MSVSSSASVAVIGVPILTPLSVFSAIDRVVLLPSANTGALFSGVSSMSLILIVTVIVSVMVPSDAVIVMV